MNKLHPLVDLTLQRNHGGISVQIPDGFVDGAEGTLVIEVDVGLVETFLAGVEYSSAEEILWKNTLTLVGAYAMPIADIDVDKPHRITWEGKPALSPSATQARIWCRNRCIHRNPGRIERPRGAMALRRNSVLSLELRRLSRVRTSVFCPQCGKDELPFRYRAARTALNNGND